MDILAQVPEAFLDTVAGEKGGMELVTPELMNAIVARLPEPPVQAPGGSAANTVCPWDCLARPAKTTWRTYTDRLSQRWAATAPNSRRPMQSPRRVV